MIAREPIEMARYALQDTNKITFSDEEMLAKLNNCLDEVYLQLVTVFSPLLEVEIPLVTVDGVMDLPLDFHAMRGVYRDGEPVPTGSDDDSFSVVNGKIRCPLDGCVLRYTRFPDALLSVDDTLPLPSFFRPLLRDMIVAGTKDDPNAIRNLAYGVRKLVGDKYMGTLPELPSWR